jgi:chromosome transmission fidelity protein 1
LEWEIVFCTDIQIYYTSRTHTQLRQLTSELLKTSFPAKIETSSDHSSASRSASSHPALEDEGVSLVPLASRRQLCINPKVQVLGKKGGDERMNEACLDMQKGGTSAGGGGRCQFLPKKEDEGEMLDMRDAVLVSDPVVHGQVPG